jgi:predicted enzyme related to lactoylglutathione lyase
MTTRDTPWPPGTPCWVDNMSTDAAAAREFYTELFGWSIEVGGEETGGYGLAKVEGHNVAGIMGTDALPHPPVWTTYLATADCAATCEAITAAGGTVVSPTMDVMDLGAMAVAIDPTGATFGLWQAKAHTGVELANEPGALTWNEQMSRDYEAAKAFYAAVFGYTYTEIGDGGFQYASIEVDGNTVGGLGGLPADVPAQVPAHWRAYLAVADTDVAVAQALALGGAVLSPPVDMPYGRHADIADPNGAAITVIAIASPPVG